jgi:hypothetical protein
MQRPDSGEPQLILLAPGEELRRRLHVSRARVLVTDSGSEEFQEVLAGFRAGAGDDSGDGCRAALYDRNGLGSLSGGSGQLVQMSLY